MSGKRGHKPLAGTTTAKRRGRKPLGAGETAMISLRLPPHLDNLLRSQAIMEDRPVSEIVRESIEQYFGWSESQKADACAVTAVVRQAIDDIETRRTT